MDELKSVKLAELRSRMSGIPVKIVVTFLFMAGMMWKFDVDKIKEQILGNPLETITLFFMIYGILSYFWFCIKLTGNWIIGIIAAIVLIFLWQINLQKISDTWSTLIGAVICFGGPALDILTIVRYVFLKKQLFSETAEYSYYEDDEEYEDDEDYEDDDEYDEDYDEDEAYEEYRRQQEWRERQRQESRQQAAPSPGFFSGCKDAASIKRRYRDLCKVYHPDAGNGSSEVFNKITEEYNRLMEGA